MESRFSHPVFGITVASCLFLDDHSSVMPSLIYLSFTQLCVPPNTELRHFVLCVFLRAFVVLCASHFVLHLNTTLLTLSHIHFAVSSTTLAYIFFVLQSLSLALSLALSLSLNIDKIKSVLCWEPQRTSLFRGLYFYSIHDLFFLTL